MAAANRQTADKDVATCLSSDKVIAGVDYVCADGTKRTGTSVMRTARTTVAVCSRDSEKGCLTTENFSAFAKVERAKLAPGNVKQGVVIAAITGTLTSAGPGTCVADGEVACVSSSAFPAAASSGLGSKVLIGQTVAGVAGNVTLPSAIAVRSIASFGATGSTSGTLADCTTDGATGCVVPANGSIKAADTANFTGWDIRKKRNGMNGVVFTFAGLAGQNKTCRNRANTQTLYGPGPNNGFSSTTAPASVGLDFFDTIDDFNNNLTGLPGEIPAWSMINGSNYGADHACGGIYATGDITTGNTGADAFVAHDINGNWQDLTPGIIPAATVIDSTNTANGCNATDKHCVFKELISGLMVTEVSAAAYRWWNANGYCDSLGEAGGVVASPIPIIGGYTYVDWRSPTQKELLHLYNAGITGLNQTSNLTMYFGSTTAFFWSASTVSNQTVNAWNVVLNSGNLNEASKPDFNKVICVR